MRTTVPTLLLLAAAVGLGAADDSPERAIRTQESTQRGVSSTATQTAQHADLLADQLRFNRVGDESDAAGIDKIGQDLAALVDSKGDGKTMSWVEDRLSHARRSGDDGDLAAASSGQGELVSRLDELAKKAQSKGADGVSALRAAIDAQQRIQDDTAKLSDQTLGKERSELSTQEKSDLEKLARQERNIEQAVQDAAKSLRDQAQSATDPQDKQNLENAAKQLDQAKADQQAKSAADKLAENQLAEAQDKQQQVLDALQQADRALSGMQQNDMAALDKQMQAMEQLQQQQQSLLDQMQAQDKSQQPMDQADWNKAQAEQQDIAKALEQMQQDKAQGAAEKAEQDLQKQDGQQAEKSMQQALDAMKQAKAGMQQKMQQMAQAQQQQQQQPPGPPMPGKPQKDSKAAEKIGDQAGLEDGQRNGKGHGTWQVALAPQEREVLSQSSADKFPARYEQALVQYYHALAGEGGDK